MNSNMITNKTVGSAKYENPFYILNFYHQNLLTRDIC